jgi:hypothetical protein
VIYVARLGHAIGGMRITEQPPAMRHFTARFAWLRPEDAWDTDDKAVVEDVTGAVSLQRDLIEQRR